MQRVPSYPSGSKLRAQLVKRQASSTRWAEGALAGRADYLCGYEVRQAREQVGELYLHGLVAGLGVRVTVRKEDARQGWHPRVVGVDDAQVDRGRLEDGGIRTALCTSARIHYSVFALPCLHS